MRIRPDAGRVADTGDVDTHPTASSHWPRTSPPGPRGSQCLCWTRVSQESSQLSVEDPKNRLNVSWKCWSGTLWPCLVNTRQAPHLHFKAGFALGHSVRGSAPSPQVSEAFHSKRGGAVSVPRHFEVQIAVVCSKQRPSTASNWTPQSLNTHLSYGWINHNFVLWDFGEFWCDHSKISCCLISKNILTPCGGKKTQILTSVKTDSGVIKFLIFLLQWGLWRLSPTRGHMVSKINLSRKELADVGL